MPRPKAVIEIKTLAINMSSYEEKVNAQIDQRIAMPANFPK